ncbi:MAG: hypothetical protein LBV19_02755 [Streptococcaceae bacterium]|jgi:antitoxin (DNA-binding transcriptional repressor) of toxin-antitoxin stability system|nr:hypothetical protein [Streptococcaceae bacterium]
MVEYNYLLESAQIAEVKENLSSYITKVQEGAVITILKGKKHEPVAQLVPIQKPKHRKIYWGALRTDKVVNIVDFTEAELDEILGEPIFPDDGGN